MTVSQITRFGDTPFPFTGPIADSQKIRTEYERMARTALAEDLSEGDLTSSHAVEEGVFVRAVIRARKGGVVSGLDAAEIVLETALRECREAGAPVTWKTRVTNGSEVAAGEYIAEVSGDARTILMVERTMLNILSHASGVATATAHWKAAVGAQVAVRDSRKTLPGMRMLQKRAVVHGGGVPHRYSLGDQAMIKDNHVLAGGGVVAVWQRVREQLPDTWCEIEVDSLSQLEDVLVTQPHQVLLDNFSVCDTRAAVALRNRLAAHCLLESSGGLTLETVGEYAACGIDSIAVGALTHTVEALDLGMDFID